MKRILPILLALLLTACVSVPGHRVLTLFDLGPLPPAATAPLPALPPVSIAEVAPPTWLDRPLMYYRLRYADKQQPRPYAESRWTMPPSQLFAQRLKARIAQAGGVALPAADGASGVPVLDIEMDDFTQDFDAPQHSRGRISIRASLFKGRTLIAQKTVDSSMPAAGADAAGGARALARASDTAIDALIRWLATQPLK